MITCQLSIFAENKPGRLAAVTKILAKEKINIRATTICHVRHLRRHQPDRR